MKTNYITLLVFLILFNCQNESKPQLDYKYAKAQAILDCGTTDTKLFEEALLSFENDLIAFYKPKNDQVGNAYSQFFRALNGNRVNFNNIISEHSIAVYEALKADKSLWKEGQQGVALNYDHPIFKCIGEHITDKNINTSYNALLSTHSLSPRMLKGAIARKVYTFPKEQHFATYVALDMFYGQLHDVDFTQPKADLSGEIINNTISSESKINSHEGQNH